MSTSFDESQLLTNHNETVVRLAAQCVAMCTLPDADSRAEQKFERELAASLESTTTCDITYALLIARIEMCSYSTEFSVAQREAVTRKALQIIATNVRQIPPSIYSILFHNI
jgi:hypothetical protein